MLRFTTNNGRFRAYNKLSNMGVCAILARRPQAADRGRSGQNSRGMKTVKLRPCILASGGGTDCTCTGRERRRQKWLVSGAATANPHSSTYLRRTCMRWFFSRLPWKSDTSTCAGRGSRARQQSPTRVTDAPCGRTPAITRPRVAARGYAPIYRPGIRRLAPCPTHRRAAF
jgi:hypothetical protein